MTDADCPTGGDTGVGTARVPPPPRGEPRRGRAADAGAGRPLPGEPTRTAAAPRAEPTEAELARVNTRVKKVFAKFDRCALL